MYLKLMQDFIEKISEAISKILGLDVVIVDSSYEQIGNTYTYDSTPFPINKMSIVGQIMETGQPIGIYKKTEYHICKNCPNIEHCKMSCVIGVPIFFREKVIGAIALIVPAWKQAESENTMVNAIGFLEKMADLLSGKIQNTVDYNDLSRVRREREVMMDYLEDAIAVTDELGSITYSNAAFSKIFTQRQNSVSITECINHPVIREALVEHNNISNRPIYYQTEKQDYFGFVNCQTLMWDGAHRGILFYFHSLRQMNSAVDSVSDSSAKMTFSAFTCQADEAMQSLTEQAKSLSVTNRPLLIQGERGTGTTLLAKAIHHFSDRSSSSFVQVYCHDLAVQDREEEIFGTVKDGKIVNLGKLWQAHNGTIYFHGVEALPRFLQDRLVDFMKTGSICQIDGHVVLVDVRLIFSTHESLGLLAEQGRFSEALYYRMKENQLFLPPLCERKGDIAYLFNRYIAFFSDSSRMPIPALDEETLERLRGYDWPGNLPELQRAAEQLVLNPGARLETLIAGGQKLRIAAAEEHASMDEMERQHIAQLLKANANKNEVAQILNISRATLYRKIKKYNLLS